RAEACAWCSSPSRVSISDNMDERGAGQGSRSIVLSGIGAARTRPSTALSLKRCLTSADYSHSSLADVRFAVRKKILKKFGNALALRKGVARIGEIVEIQSRQDADTFLCVRAIWTPCRGRSAIGRKACPAFSRPSQCAS